MKKQLFTTLILFIVFKSYSQITFEKGYFINNNGEKTECLIKNEGWLQNPEEFKYKIDENGPVKVADLLYVKEFGVLNTSKYKRFLVKIDQSPSSLSNLSHQKSPEWEEESLFLKTLIEGEGTLYLYERSGTKRFFFSVNDSPVEQLVFKEYLSSSDNKIRKNNQFKQQLWSNARWESLSMEYFKNINYTERDLITYFTKFNTYKNSTITTYTKNKKLLLDFKIVLGVSLSSLSIYQPGNLYITEKKVEFDNEINFKIGAEAEFIMPFNRNKWSFFLQPSYQYFKSEKDFMADVSSDTANINYKSIEIPLGIRHYFFLGNDSKLFVNAAFVFNFAFNSRIVFEYRPSLNIGNTTTMTLGFGYNKNRYGVAFRYVFNGSIANLSHWDSKYNSISLNFKYSIFK